MGIELQVADEKAALEQRVSELEQECDNARATADGMEKASTRLSRELVKVHEQYSRQPGDEAEGESGQVNPDAAPASTNITTDGIGGELVASAEQNAKTGELLQLNIYRAGEVVELHAREMPAGEESRMQLPPELLQELAQEDPWTELFSRV